MDLVGIGDVKSFMSLTESSNDGLIGTLIKGVSIQIEQYCNRLFEQAERTEYPMDAPGKSLFRVKAAPIVSVASLYDDPNRAFDSSTLIAADKYAVWEETGIIELDGYVFSAGRRVVKITYTGGWLANEIPDDIKLAAKTQVAFFYDRRKTLSHKSISLGRAGGITYEDAGLLPVVKSLCNPYKPLGV